MNKILLGLGLVFEMPILVFFLARLGLITPKFMIKNLRYAVLIIFIVAVTYGWFISLSTLSTISSAVGDWADKVSVNANRIIIIIAEFFLYISSSRDIFIFKSV